MAVLNTNTTTNYPLTCTQTIHFTDEKLEHLIIIAISIESVVVVILESLEMSDHRLKKK